MTTVSNLYLSRNILIYPSATYNAELWKAAQTKRFETQHLGLREINSAGSISLLLGVLKSRSSLSQLSVVSEKQAHSGIQAASRCD